MRLPTYKSLQVLEVCKEQKKKKSIIGDDLEMKNRYSVNSF